MELRFQRPQQREIDYASVMLKAGDTIDDSMAAFGAINLSGEQKKALNSLSLGMFQAHFPLSSFDIEIAWLREKEIYGIDSDVKNITFLDEKELPTPI